MSRSYRKPGSTEPNTGPKKRTANRKFRRKAKNVDIDMPNTSCHKNAIYGACPWDITDYDHLSEPPHENDPNYEQLMKWYIKGKRK